MSFEVTVTPQVYNVEVEVNPSVQPFDVQVIANQDLKDLVDEAKQYAEDAEDSADSASASASSASQSASDAQHDADVATNQALLASAARLNAQNAANDAQDSADASAQSASSALASATSAELDAIATASDRVQTGLDRQATGSDRVQTGLDRVATGADRVQTGLDASTATTQAGIATTQAGIATTQAGIATTKASEANQSAVNALASQQSATASASSASGSASTATTQAGIATTQAGISTTQAGIATTQAGIATTQAGIATTQASNALSSANNALASENSASSSASTATTQAGIATTQAGNALTSANNALSSANAAAASASSAAQVGTSTLLTGFATGANTTIAGTDTILQAFNKTQGQINARVSGTGTSGQVAFWSGATSQAGSNNLFWDNANGRLGIGTNAPSQRLSVAGSINFTTPGYLLSSSGQIIAGEDAGGTYINAGTNNSSPARMFIGRMNTSIEFQTNGGLERMRIATGGNVLINTTTDAGFRLDVNGTARVQGALTVGIAGNGTVLDLFTNGVGYNPVTVSNSGTTFRTNGSNPAITASIFSVATNQVGINGRRPLTLLNIYRSSFGGGNDSFTVVDGATGNIQFGIRFGGNVLVNTNVDIASSIFTIESTTQGFLPPRMTLAQRDLIATPATGLMVYNTTDNRPSFYNGTSWINL